MYGNDLEQKKQKLLHQMLGGRPGSPGSLAAISGGHSLGQGLGFGQSPRYANPLLGVLAQYGGENLGGINPAAVGQAQSDGLQGARPGGQWNQFDSQAPPASQDTGGTQMLFPSQSGWAGQQFGAPNPGQKFLGRLGGYGGRSPWM